MAVNRKIVNTTLSKDNVEKLSTLAKKAGKPKARILDEAVDALFEKREDETAPKQCVTISVANNKGGVGKTTSTAAIAFLLSKMGKHVLVIDADPQGNLSGRFGYDTSEQAPKYLGAVIEDRLQKGPHQPISYYITHLAEFPRIDLIYSDVRLDSDYEVMNANSVKSMTMFRKIVEEIKTLDTYDYIFIDTRPSLGNAVASAFIASDYLLVPINAAYDSITGANNVVNFMATAREVNPDLKMLGVFFNMVENRTKAFHEIQPMVQGSWAAKVFDTCIPRNQANIDAENEGAPITYRYPSSKASKAYSKLVGEMVSRLEKA